jgi:hypothetical protein
MRLLTSQKNELFNLIVSCGFAPHQFKLSEGTPQGVKRVVIQYNSIVDFKFRINDSERHEFFLSYSPGLSLFKETRSADSWFQVTNYFKDWLDNITRELTQEDLWLTMSQMVASVNLNSGTDNDKFTVQQYLLVTERMKQFQQGISALSLPADQIETINKKLDHILEQGKTLGKFDWQAQFVGGLFTLIVALTISPDVGKQIFDLMRQFFSQMLLLP